MNKKIIVIIITIIVICIGSILIFKHARKGNTSGVQITILENNGHKRSDIEQVMKMIKKEFFSLDFKDCKLLKMEYPKSNSLDAEEEIKKEYGAQEAIILSFTFKTGKNPDIVFNPQSEYTYSAWFVKKEQGKWEKVNWGQG